jgi:hypothetical protein
MRGSKRNGFSNNDGSAKRVNDRWIFLFVYPVIALLSVHIGNDNTFQELLHIPSYYSDLLLAFSCVYGLGWYYRWFFFRLRQKFNREMQMRKRIIAQVILGVIFPVASIIGLEMLYLIFFLDIPIRTSSIFYLELPVAGTFCIALNLLYYLLYFREHNLELKQRLERHKEAFPENEKKHKKDFIVTRGFRTFPISEDNIAYFLVSEKSTFLVTTDNKRYLIGNTLDQLEKIVQPEHFFRLNRQIIANRRSIQSYSHTESRKLRIELSPEPGMQAFVPKTRSSRFIRWFKKG